MNQEIHEEENVAQGTLDGDAWMNCMKQRILVAGRHGPKHEEHLIYRVHSDLRKGNESCYEPFYTSIGPYHHAKEHLLDMETHKKRYVCHLLSRNKNIRFEYLVNMMKEREQRVRGCYPAKINLTSEAFVEMLLVDGCFIVELLLKLGYGHRQDDLIVGPRWRPVKLLYRDLLLLENQLPFFLLQEIFQVVMPNETDALALVKYSLKLLKRIKLTQTQNEKLLPMAPESVHHLLHLWHTLLIQFPAEQPQDSKILNLAPCLDHMCNCCKGTKQEKQELVWMPGITQLQEAGVKFKASSSNLLDIKFHNGEMIIPKIYVHDGTETLLRNLIAFEQGCLTSFPNFYFTCYATFLDFLINTSKDVEILHEKGILTNWLGESEEVSRLFNKSVKGAVISLEKTYLANTFKMVNEYRSRKIPKWRASLVRDYFYSPWAILSFIAAIIMLSLTATRTVFSVHQPKQ